MENLGEDKPWRSVCFCLRSELDTGFKHVSGLDGSSGDHTGAASNGKVFEDLLHSLFFIYVYVLLVHGYYNLL